MGFEHEFVELNKNEINVIKVQLKFIEIKKHKLIKLYEQISNLENIISKREEFVFKKFYLLAEKCTFNQDDCCLKSKNFCNINDCFLLNSD